MYKEFSAVLTAHFRTHEALEPQDVYKLIYQRVFGPEHLIDNPRAAWERLYLEVLQLPQTTPTGPLLEALSPELCRVNLHPFMHQGGSVETLWQAFRQTTRTYRPDRLEDLQRTWRLFLRTSWASRYAPEQLEQFWLRMATADFPPVHHSRAYTAANAPHYRVVRCALVSDHPPFTP
jgi:hypothetical protein